MRVSRHKTPRTCTQTRACPCTRTRRVLAATVAIVVVGASACAGDDPSADVAGATSDCTWPMAGHDLARSATTDCDRSVDASTVDRLEPVWFFETAAEVTGAPVADGESIYFGDWDGRLYAVDRGTGEQRWRQELPTSPHMYAGQSPASPALSVIEQVDAVLATSGSTVVASRRDDGTEIWSTDLARPSDPADPTEIQGAVVPVGDVVLVPTDVHNAEGYRSGLVALSLVDGSERWRFDPEEGLPAGGCGSIWGSPAVDLEANLVVVGTGNCSQDSSWSAASEALVGLDLATGALRWSYQPHERGNDNDWDFAGAPNLFEIDGRAVAGLGNKDGSYYVVDRRDGELVWSAEAQKQTADGGGFSVGGFIGALAVVDGVVVGGTAVGDCPCQHGFDAATGEPLWQSDEPTGTYAPAAAVSSPEGSLVFQAGVDQTLRAFDPANGEVLWESTLPTISSSGPTIAGEELFIGTGFREPGSPPTGSGGVQAFRVLGEGERPPPASSTTVPGGSAVRALAPTVQDCVGSPCSLLFELKDPPEGTSPSVEMSITTDPFRLEVRAAGLGDPLGWLDPDGPAAVDGATTYMAFLTPRDDKPELGSILCTFEPDGTCTAEEIPVRAEQWTRLSILAVRDAETPPTLAEGFDRLVTTHSFDPPLRPLDAGTNAGSADRGPIMLSGQGNNLDAYAFDGAGGWSTQRVVTTREEDPDGLDINAQLCVFERDGERLMIAGEDTGQPDPPAGWGIFELTGEAVGGLSAHRVAKLTPTYQPSPDGPENYGCGVLADGRILTTDVGQQALGDTGQLIMWFPPFEGFAEGDISYCKLDVALPTAQSILVTGADRFLVAAARGGIFEYRGPFPTGPGADEGCGRRDPTDRPLADVVDRRVLVAPGSDSMATPAGLAPAPDGGFYASSVFNGVINEYAGDGTFRRNILTPPPGETVGAEPLSTGTPLGIATDAEGSLWYADIGLVLDPEDGMGPGDGTGTLRVIRFVDGEPQAPVIVASGLAFPDGVGAFSP